MTTHDPIEASLERLKETVSLRADEKAQHREQLEAFMKKGRVPVRSPYAWIFGHGMQMVAGLLVIVLAGGGGIVSASESARPGDSLYIVKLRVTEPARSALILDKEKKTEFELERADRRLKEFAIAAAEENPDPETTALIASSLSESIADISEDVTVLAAAGDADEALATNADLQSVLSAHSSVLDAIEEQNPAVAEDVGAISVSVDSGIASTENAEQGIVDALGSSLATDEPVAEQAVEAEVSIAALLKQIEAETATIDAADQTAISEGLADINTIVADAWAAREAGDRKSAYLLYTEANQRLAELTTFIEADRDLGIGVAQEEVVTE